MGAALQSAGAAELVAELTCCACSSVCGLVTKDSATRAKFRYCSFLFMATITCIILLIPGLRYKLDKIPNFCGTRFITSDTCDKFVGYSAVYRILFALSLFHFILSILTLRVTRIKSFRAKFNNNLWLFKMSLLMALTVSSFYIPKKSGFFRIWMYISLTGGFMFVMFQIILIIDFGHSWSLSWAEKLEAGHTKIWYLAMAFVTLLMFSISLGAMISFYTFFTHPPDMMKCHANVFYISFIGLQCVLAAIISVTPSVQQELVGAGLLQSSVVILYTMYLTWNTLSTEPDSTCNPLGNIILEYDSLTGVSGEAIFGCLLTMTLLIFACVVRANTSHLGRYGLALAESEEYAMSVYYEDKTKEGVENKLENGNKEVCIGEYVGYNYSFFHAIMMLASLHILMVLTNWHSPEENSNMKKLVKNWVSVWVQMASSFVCILVYVWFLVTPLVKKLWGPLFGIYVYDTLDQTPSKGLPTHRRNGPTMNGDNAKRPQSTHLNTFKSSELENETKPRPTRVKNTAVFDNTRSTILRKYDNIKTNDFSESVANSAVDTIMANSKRIRHRQKQISIADISVTGSVFSSRRLDRKNRRHTETNDENFETKSKFTEITTKENKQGHANISNKNIHEQRTSENSKHFLSSKLSIVTSCQKTKNKVQKNIAEGVSHQNDENASIVSNKSILSYTAMKTKIQKPDIAKEILDLQWKILRSQAKVVKIQERIIKLQSELPDKNNLQKTVDDNLSCSIFPPPLLESSAYVDNNDKFKNNQKEHG